MVNSKEIRVYMVRNDNMTIKALAEKIGTSPATLSRWLEKQDMPISYAEKIGEALSIPRHNWGPIFFCPGVA
ncbi:MAG: helix-turn-helix transcriptional regulator [Oscillospiraceae bacterium]|nr:helix-turn-helix transcriptional regulator [Oscillospiraceae bacterium]